MSARRPSPARLAGQLEKLALTLEALDLTIAEHLAAPAIAADVALAAERALAASRQLRATFRGPNPAPGADLALPLPSPAIVSVRLTGEQRVHLGRLLGEINRPSGGTPTTHGPLDVHGLAALLLEDAALAYDRPGSWEGAGLRDVLRRHGYAA